MSLYGEYLKERGGDQIIESEFGFVTYRYLDPNQVYIVDIYVMPDVRKGGLASDLADKVVSEAKACGCTKLIGTVAVGKAWTTTNTKVLLGYGFSISEATADAIIFRKDI